MIKTTLLELLKSRKMTQLELAKSTGIRPSTICDICNNSCSFLKLEHLNLICNFLDCNISDIIKIQ